MLLVDDDPVILRLLELNFQLEGFETMTASRGPEAMALAAFVQCARQAASPSLRILRLRSSRACR